MEYYRGEQLRYRYKCFRVSPSRKRRNRKPESGDQTRDTRDFVTVHRERVFDFESQDTTASI